MMAKRIYRSRDERMIWGVCGGIAKYFDVDPTLIRLIAVLTLFFAFTGILIYIILTIIIPLEPRAVSE
jgi:phage shock protein PspC (stress-responsive transcriptional regulator)